MGATWIDITVPVHDGMVHWPENPPVKVKFVKDRKEGDRFAVSQLQFGSHVGTHLDAPRHFFPEGPSLSDWSPEITVGHAKVIELGADVAAVTRTHLERHEIAAGDRLLIKTRNSRLWRTGDDTFHEDYVALTPDAARYLAGLKPRCIGVDYLSVGPFDDDENTAVHKTLLGAGVWVIEGLDLSQVAAGEYELLCLPLRLRDRDGSPVRAMLARSSV